LPSACATNLTIVYLLIYFIIYLFIYCSVPRIPGKGRQRTNYIPSTILATPATAVRKPHSVVISVPYKYVRTANALKDTDFK